MIIAPHADMFSKLVKGTDVQNIKLIVIAEPYECEERDLHNIVDKAKNMGILTLFICVRHKESHSIITVKADSVVTLIYDRDYAKNSSTK